MLVDERKSFTCVQDGIEVYGTVQQQPHTRNIGEKSFGINYYEVGLVVAGVRRYRFKLNPDFADDETPRYKIWNIERLSAVRDHVIDHVLVANKDNLPLPVEQTFEAAIARCVEHFKAKPPAFPVPADEQTSTL